MFDGWFSVVVIGLVSLLVSAGAVTLALLFSPKRRRAKRAGQRRKDRIDLTSGAKE